MGVLLSDYPPPAREAIDQPLLWVEPSNVRKRPGDVVDEPTYQTRTVRIPVLSPAHYWGQTTRESRTFIVVLEAVPTGNRAPLREEVVETVALYVGDDQTAVSMADGTTKPPFP